MFRFALKSSIFLSTFSSQTAVRSLTPADCTSHWLSGLLLVFLPPVVTTNTKYLGVKITLLVNKRNTLNKMNRYNIYQKTVFHTEQSQYSNNKLRILKITRESMSWWLFVKCIDRFSTGAGYTEFGLTNESANLQQTHFRMRWTSKIQTNISL